jgi:serine phosphatase RsbU (regulator of sigma subunit)
MNAMMGEGLPGGLKIEGESRPAGAAGGDFFRVIELGGDRLTIVFGDVSGNGPAAAARAASIIPEVDRLARRGLGPRALLARLNERLAAQGEEGHSLAAVCLQLDLARGRFTVANAGHVPAFVGLPCGRAAQVGVSSGPPLGALPGQLYAEESHALPAGALMALVTDGIADGFRSEDDPLGVAAVTSIVAACRADATKARALLVAGAAAGEDATVLLLRTASEPHAPIVPVSPAPARAA